MHPITFQDVELVSLKVQCVPLLLECPLHKFTRACPLRKVRKEAIVTRVNWLKSLDGPRIMKVLAKHAKCMAMPAIPAEVHS